MEETNQYSDENYIDEDIDKDIDEDIDEDGDEDEEIIEPNKFIDEEFEYMADYDEEEKEYYKNAWNKDYNNIITDNITNNIIIKKKKVKKVKKVKKLLDITKKYKYMFDPSLTPWKYRVTTTISKNIFSSDDFPSL
jgi:hypothetical protein